MLDLGQFLKSIANTTMGPTRTVKSSAKGTKDTVKPGALGAKSKSRISKKPKIPPKQQKTTSATVPARKKQRVYTDKELGIPKLNMITPVGVDLPKGKKKGKVFVDDQVREQPAQSKRTLPG